jgi:hypothetical protein
MDTLRKTVEARFVANTQSFEAGTGRVEQQMARLRGTVTYTHVECTKGKTAADAWAKSQVQLATATRHVGGGFDAALASGARFVGTIAGVTTAAMLLARAYQTVEQASKRAFFTGLDEAGKEQEALERIAVLNAGNAREIAKLKTIISENRGGLFSRSDVAAAVSYAGAFDLNAEKVDRLLPSVRNLAHLFDMQLTPALEAVSYAIQSGNSGWLRKHGIFLDEARMNEEAIRIYGRKVAALHDSEAAAIRYTEALRAMEARFANIRTDVEPLPDLLQEAGAAWKDAFADLVAPTIPVLSDVAKKVIGLAAAVRALGTAEEYLLEKGHLSIFGKGGGSPGEEKPNIPPPTSLPFGPVSGSEWDYLTWKDKQVAQLMGKGQEAAYMARLQRERPDLFPSSGMSQADKDWLEIQNARTERGMGLAGPWGGRYSPESQDVTKDTPAEAARKRKLQNEAEIEKMILADREAAWEGFSKNVMDSYGSAIDTMSVVMGKFFNREVNSHAKMVALWRWAGKQFVSSTLEAISDVAKEKAKFYLGEAVAKQAEVLLGPMGAAGFLKAAAIMGGIAMVTGGLAQATAAGAQRELGAFNQQSIVGASEQDRITGTSRAGKSSGSILGRIERGPENVYYTFHTYFQAGVNMIGMTESTFDALWRQYMLPRVQRSVELGEIKV